MSGQLASTFSFLAVGFATIDGDGLAGDKTGVLVGEKEGCVGDVLRGSPAADGDGGEIVISGFLWYVVVALDRQRNEVSLDQTPRR